MPLGPLSTRELGRYVALAQVGLELVAPAGIGLLLDYYFGWSPWGVVTGAVLGLIAGLAHLVALTNRPDDTGRSERGPNGA
ncbi:MAG: AtpZ/AtpI family protein [Gemmataceae bacterium]|nr:AtpZ/AtpI family protein [Gemmataceae bacterium]MDW8265127.1 AtpZ/AtpI family protein [Gemmataceae bacterium]